MNRSNNTYCDHVEFNWKDINHFDQTFSFWVTWFLFLGREAGWILFSFFFPLTWLDIILGGLAICFTFGVLDSRFFFFLLGKKLLVLVFAIFGRWVSWVLILALSLSFKRHNFLSLYVY
jgi:hypothetical protein